MSIFAILYSVVAVAATHYPVLSSYELKRPDAATFVAVSKYYGTEHRHGDTFEIIVPEDEAAFFLSLAPRAVLKTYDTAAEAQNLLLSPQFARGYRNFNEVKAWMQAKETTYPALAQMIQYGTSGEGRELLALRVRTETEGVKPALLITAATHGDELITTEVLLHLVDRLLAGFGTDARFTKMIDKHDIYFVPVVNPDGFVATRRHDGRVDPNRSYPWPENTANAPSPSIDGLIQLFNVVRPAGSIDFHAYGEMVMYPWAYTRESVNVTNKEKMHALTRRMAETNNYRYGPISEVIYIAPGSSADYYFWKAGTMGIAIEIGRQKIPNAAEIPAHVDSQAESTWRFIEAF